MNFSQDKNPSKHRNFVSRIQIYIYIDSKMKHKRKWLFVHTAIIFMFTIFELFIKAIIYPVRFRCSNILGLLLIIEDSDVALQNERVFYLLLHIDEFPLSLSSASFCRIAWCSSSCRLFQRWCSVNYSSMIKINHQLYGKRTFFRQFNKLDQWIFLFLFKRKEILQHIISDMYPILNPLLLVSSS